MKYLDDGRVACETCKGTGFTQDANNFVHVCDYCCGKGIMDWIEFVMYKPPVSKNERDALLLKHLHEGIFIKRSKDGLIGE